MLGILLWGINQGTLNILFTQTIKKVAHAFKAELSVKNKLKVLKPNME